MMQPLGRFVMWLWLTTLKWPRYVRPVSSASMIYEPCSSERFSGVNWGGSCASQFG